MFPEVLYVRSNFSIYENNIFCDEKQNTPYLVVSQFDSFANLPAGRFLAVFAIHLLFFCIARIARVRNERKGELIQVAN